MTPFGSLLGPGVGVGPWVEVGPGLRSGPGLGLGARVVGLVAGLCEFDQSSISKLRMTCHRFDHCHTHTHTGLR